MWRFIALGSLSVAAALATVTVPSTAEACGGTFCDGGLPPGSMPVNQTGETILFALDNGYVEAHVQIEYDGGDANQFAWLVPVPEIPEIEVGSWRLVQSALAATVPVYGFEDNWMCEGMDPPPTGGGGFISEPDGGGAGGGGPAVVAQDVVGAFEYAILQGGSSATVTQWLLDNDYAVEEEAPTILDEYITEGHVFVAFKLRHGQGVEDIHPVVIRYPGTEPCIPIRLTRVAAEDDMEIRALFLGEARVVPTTYRHVLLNRTRLNWLGYGNNYADLVSMAVDAPGADGRAFVTEYAGTSDIIDTTLLDTSQMDSSVYADLPVVDVVNVLQDQGLVSCTQFGCEWLHELVPSLLHEFVPVPANVDEGDFYSCLSCYAGLIDGAAWDPAGFIAAYDERIVAPLDHADELLATWPYVTRLYTRISPHEMLSDPMFTENPELEDVANRHGAQRNQACCGNQMQLPGGRSIALVQGAGWPMWPDTMPWAERVEEYSAAAGAPIVLADESALIDSHVEQWNQVASCSDDDPTGGTGGSGGGNADDGELPPLDTGDDPTGGPGGSAGLGDDQASGCGCRSAGEGGLAWMLMALGLGLGSVRRRRSA